MSSIVRANSGSSATNPKPYIVAPTGWNTGWLTAKAAGHGTIMLVGDSIMGGSVALSDVLNKRLAHLLGATYTPKVAEYFPIGDNISHISPWSATGSAPWTAGTAAGQAYVSTDFIRAETATGTTGTIGTFVTPFACTDLDIVFRDRASGTLQWTVDGVSQTNVTTVGNNLPARAQATGLANTTHTVVVGPQSVSTQIELTGITLYAGARAAVGYTIANHVCGGQYAGAFVASLFGICKCYEASKATLGPIAAPDLAIIGLGINDCGQANVANMQTGLYWIAKSILFSNPSASIVFLSMCNPSSTATDVAAEFGSSTAQTWGQYTSAIAQLAATFGAAFINIDTRWGSAPVASGFIASGTGAGQPHPNDAGIADIASALGVIL